MTNRRVQSLALTAERTVRASVSFPEDQYAELERIALSKRVSLAWVVRDAVQTYLTSRWPLLDSASLTVHTENENENQT